MCLGRAEGDTEDRVNELTLVDRITLGYPADLPFADGMHRLITFDRSARSLGRSESEARRNPLLDEPMVLLDDVVQIRGRSATTASTEFTILLQLGNRAGVGRMPVHVDHPWRRPAGRQGEPQEQLGRDQVAFGRPHELDGLAGRVDRAIQKAHLPATLIYVSSTRQDRLRSRISRRIR